VLESGGLVTRAKWNGGSALLACAPCIGFAIAVGCGGGSGEDLFDHPAAVHAGTSGKRGSETGGSSGSGGTAAGGSAQGAEGGRLGNAGGAAGDDEGSAGRAGSASQSGGNGATGGSLGNGGEAATGGEDDPLPGGTGGTPAGSGGQVNPSGGGGASGGVGGEPNGTGGSTPAEGGAGGEPIVCDDCDDANPCTDDTCTKDGCAHTPNTAGCDDDDVCTVDDHCSEGECKAGTSQSCDDDNACTLDRCDPQAGCGHEPVSGSASDDDDQHIADGDKNCGQAPSNDVRSTLTLSDPGTVASVSVSVELKHPWVGDLVIELIHDGVTVRIVNQPPNGMGTNAGELDGVYTFKVGAAALPFRASGGKITPGTYRPFEPFAAFEGRPVEGEWTLRVADYCNGDDGEFSAFTLEVSAACAGAAACDGVCRAGACQCE
jgi:subtilisin-like proprotein convertase family protein